MAKQKDEPLSEATESLSDEESSLAIEAIAPVETWTTMAGETPLGEAGSQGLQSETAPPSLEAPPTGEGVASVETWTTPVEEGWVPTPDELWPLPPGGIPEVGAESEIALKEFRKRF